MDLSRILNPCPSNGNNGTSSISPAQTCSPNPVCDSDSTEERHDHGGESHSSVTTVAISTNTSVFATTTTEGPTFSCTENDEGAELSSLQRPVTAFEWVKNATASRADPVAKHEWETHRAELFEQYARMTLEDLMAHMQTTYGFKAS